MSAIDKNRFLEYIHAKNEMAIAYKTLYQAYSKQVNEKDNILEIKFLQENYSKYVKLTEVKQKEFIEGYSNQLVKWRDFKQEYFNDIIKAASNDDLELIKLLLDCSTKLPLLSSKTDVFLLNYFVELFKREPENLEKIGQAKVLFEEVLDTADNNLKSYIEILDKVFTLGKSDNWYDDFNQQVQKLIYRAPISKATFNAVKKGLSISPTYKDMPEDLRNYIEQVYIKQGLVDKDYNWIGNDK